MCSSHTVLILLNKQWTVNDRYVYNSLSIYFNLIFTCITVWVIDDVFWREKRLAVSVIKYKFPSPPIFWNLSDVNLFINFKWPKVGREKIAVVVTLLHPRPVPFIFNLRLKLSVLCRTLIFSIFELSRREWPHSSSMLWQNLRKPSFNAYKTISLQHTCICVRQLVLPSLRWPCDKDLVGTRRVM